MSSRSRQQTFRCFDDLAIIISRCLGKNLMGVLKMRKFRNSDESKLAILPTPIDANRSCIVVTLGIGKDILAEKSLRKILPHCRFYGADPIFESGHLYQKIGQYFQVAVGAESGIKGQNVLKGGKYQWEEVKTVEYKEFLSQYAKVDRIDYLWMDAKGAEYGTIRRYFIDQIPIKVCQFNVEMHGPLEKYGMTNSTFDDLMAAILSKSPYLPFDSVHGHHTRLFLLIPVIQLV